MTKNSQIPNRIVLFARTPELGKVKTRLSPALNNTQILELHKRLVHHAIKVAMAYDNAVLELWISEAVNSDVFFSELSVDIGPFEIHQQQGDDLGARMSHALTAALTRSEKTVIIGSDCPGLSSHYFDAAFSSLDENCPVVFGPALDGGYVLLGARCSSLPLFEAMPWGTDRVLSISRQRLDNSKVNYSELSALADIDRPEDIAVAISFGLWPA